MSDESEVQRKSGLTKQELDLHLAVAAIALTILGMAVSWWHQHQQKLANKERLSVQKYEEYYSPSFYMDTIVPTQATISFWNDPKTTDENKQTIVRGWISKSYFSDPDRRSLYELDDDFTNQYFNTDISDVRYTSHQVLAVYIWYWHGIAQLIRENRVDQDLTRRLQKYGYNIRREFLTDFANLLENEAKTNQSTVPAWVDSIKFLNKFFDEKIRELG